MDEQEQAAAIKGNKLGMSTAVAMARAGNLRLAALPYERGTYPYTVKLQPVRATLLIWRAWWRELRG